MSPVGFVSWFQIATEFWAAKSDPLSLKVWVNTRKGETFESAGDQPAWTMLQGRCEPYPMMTCPAGGLFITVGVDVQLDRIAVVMRAWGMGEESWLVFHGEFYDDAWGQLDQLLASHIESADGRNVPIISVGVDSGYRTQDVYNYCRLRGPRVFALKGSMSKNKPIVGKPTLHDVTYRGKVITQGIKLWPIGVDTAKSTIYGRFKEKSQPGAGCYHWYIGASEEYFLQVTAEKLETSMKDGFPVMDWIKTRDRNEALDCEVYAYAAALRVGMAWMHMGEKKPFASSDAPKKINEAGVIASDFLQRAQRPKITVRSSFMSK
jgi:phage terminase large subunit GpA-like protein